MSKEELKELLREHLTVDLVEKEDMYSKDIEVKISFDGEEITTSSLNIERKPF